jgi:hypothetical protein
MPTQPVKPLTPRDYLTLERQSEYKRWGYRCTLNLSCKKYQHSPGLKAGAMQAIHVLSQHHNDEN